MLFPYARMGKPIDRGGWMRGAFVLLATSICPLFAQNQPPKTIADSVLGPLRMVEGQLLGVAEAMPESKYSFIPASGNFEGVRSFAEQIKHVACGQFAFFNEIEGKTPPPECEKGGPSKASTKAELIQYLRDSFDYGNRVLATIDAKNQLDRVEGRYAGPTTRLGMGVIAVWHITDHYGQLVEYLRMNGIVPPATQSYLLNGR
jgi:uncharacterized damage-inducible protein DinB